MRQTLRDDFEVIVVVDGSTDGSAEALRNLKPDIALTVVEQENLGLSAARNAGARIARGELLLFLDDDMTAEPDLLAEHDRAQAKKMALVLGHVPNHPDSPSNFLSDAVSAWANDRLERLSRLNVAEQLQDWVMGQSSISRALFFELGCFDDVFTRGGSYGDEDLEFCYRVRQAGVPIVFNANAISRQTYIVSPRTHLQQWFESGGADVQFVRKHPELVEQIFPKGSSHRWFTSFAHKPLRWFSLVAVKLCGGSRVAQRLFFATRAVCYAEGVQAAGGVPRPRPVHILCYHAIADLSNSVLEPYGIPPGQFRRQIVMLQRHGYHFVTAGEFLRFLDGESGLPRRALLLTFDDCYQSLVDVALPVLRELGVPAVAFAVSEKIGGSNDWDEHLGAPALKLADTTALKDLESSGIEVASHSCNHRNLNTLSDEELCNEVNQSPEKLRSIGLEPIPLFAYPYGEHDQRVRNAVQIAGFDAAMTTEYGIVGLTPNRYRLPRVEIMAGDSLNRIRFRLCRDRLLAVVKARFEKKARATPVATVIIPAFNAASTLTATLESVRAQTFTGWAAIIIDDGSTDTSAEIAKEWCDKDSRFRLLRRENGGEAAARNTGIEATTSDWLIFLDADDWIAPEYLERMLNKAAENDQLDGIVCGCTRVTPEGLLTAQAVYRSEDLSDPFPKFVRDCPLAIHNCMIKRSMALEVGGFDETLETCADWDFWQRVARIGVRLGAIPEVLAMYRIRPGSSSTNAARVLADGQRVIRRGYAKDPRVPNASPPRYSDGLETDDLGEALYRHTLWPACMQIACGQNAVALLDSLSGVVAPRLGPEQVGEELFHNIPLAAGATIVIWPELFPVLEERLSEFLQALELRSGADGLAEVASRDLERRILECADFEDCLALGASYGSRTDITQPIKEINPDLGTRQVVLVVIAQQDRVGTATISAPSNSLQPAAIAEALVEQLSWPIMRNYLGLQLPSESAISFELHALADEARPIPLLRKLLAFAYSFAKWQRRNAALRERAVIKEMFGLLIDLKPPSLLWRLWKAPPGKRKTMLANALGCASRGRAQIRLLLSPCAYD